MWVNHSLLNEMKLLYKGEVFDLIFFIEKSQNYIVIHIPIDVRATLIWQYNSHHLWSSSPKKHIHVTATALKKPSN